MARKSKRLKSLVVEKSDIASSDEEIATPSRPGKKRRVLSDKNIIITIRGSKGMDCDDDDNDDDISYPRISCGRQ